MDAEGFGATVADVDARLVADFSGDELAAARQVLDEVATLSHLMGPAPRVQVAILLLAEGHLDLVRRWADVAATDSRDVLAAAFYPDA